MMRRSAALVTLWLALQGGPAQASYCQAIAGGPTPNYVNQGLGTLANVSIYQIFLDAYTGSYWTTFPGNVQGLNIETWGYVTNTPAFWSRVSEYGVGRDPSTHYQ